MPAHPAISDSGHLSDDRTLGIHAPRRCRRSLTPPGQCRRYCRQEERQDLPSTRIVPDTGTMRRTAPALGSPVPPPHVSAPDRTSRRRMVSQVFSVPIFFMPIVVLVIIFDVGPTIEISPPWHDVRLQVERPPCRIAYVIRTGQANEFLHLRFARSESDEILLGSQERSAIRHAMQGWKHEAKMIVVPEAYPANFGIISPIPDRQISANGAWETR